MSLRELDMFIHQKIMGKILNPHEDLPKYSSDLTTAWEVVEKIKQKGYTFKLLSAVSDTYNFVEFRNNLEKRVVVSRGSIPELICKAALKVCDIEP